LEYTYPEILLFLLLLSHIILGGLVVNLFGPGSVISRGQVYLIQQDNNTISNVLNDEDTNTARGLSVSIGTSLDNHYYKTLMRGRGLLFADQQLMANEKTVTDYAIDDGIIFRTEFAHAMGKLSNFGVLTGSEGEVRHSCSHLNS